MFQNFMGRAPEVGPMLEARGLVPGDEAADSEVADDGAATIGDSGMTMPIGN